MPSVVASLIYMAIKCKSCGAENHDDATMCEYCNAELEAKPAVVAPSSPPVVLKEQLKMEVDVAVVADSPSSCRCPRCQSANTRSAQETYELKNKKQLPQVSSEVSAVIEGLMPPRKSFVFAVAILVITLIAIYVASDSRSMLVWGAVIGGVLLFFTTIGGSEQQFEKEQKVWKNTQVCLKCGRKFPLNPSLTEDNQ